jgi:N-acetylglutamate synthase-like GNAT family acetyltransferase
MPTENGFPSNQNIEFVWRGNFTNEALNQLHAEGFNHRLFADDWRTQVSSHSLGWVCARHNQQLIGFVNVAWDGGVHAFILDTLVTDAYRHRGIATRMIELCTKEAKRAGCEWLHVDFEDHLKKFYFDRCGFQPTNAGLIKLL